MGRNTCQQQCQKYRALKRPGSARYKNGQKYCPPCMMWMYWEGVRCPCCHEVLRTKSRSTKSEDRWLRAY